jgi:hypothetical protein
MTSMPKGDTALSGSSEFCADRTDGKPANVQAAISSCAFVANSNYRIGCDFFFRLRRFCCFTARRLMIFAARAANILAVAELMSLHSKTLPGLAPW